MTKKCKICSKCCKCDEKYENLKYISKNFCQNSHTLVDEIEKIGKIVRYCIKILEENHKFAPKNESSWIL